MAGSHAFSSSTCSGVASDPQIGLVYETVMGFAVERKQRQQSTPSAILLVHLSELSVASSVSFARSPRTE
jgi:hypothetical protein